MSVVIRAEAGPNGARLWEDFGSLRAEPRTAARQTLGRNVAKDAISPLCHTRCLRVIRTYRGNV